MPEQNPAAGAVTTPPAFDPAALSKIVSESVAAATQSLVDRLAKLEAPEPKEKKATAAESLTAEGVTKLVTDALVSHRASESKRNAKQRYSDSKMTDLPAIYRQQLPETDSEAELAAAEQRIRTVYVEDFKKAGGAARGPVGNTNPGGAAPTQAVDVSALSGGQLIQMGLGRSKPGRGGRTPSERAAEAAAAK